jgi:radical SAM protein with 4Fe4S-binding SPASM domain
MCPYDLMTRGKQKMGMELFARIVDDAVGAGIRQLSLSHYNEPLLDDLLFERVRYAKTRNMEVQFVTNGVFLNDQKIIEVLKAGLSQILFSFDGATKESYETIRRGADFDIVRGNILRLVQERNNRRLRKPLVYVCFVLQKDNYEEAIAFRDFWKGIADIVNISPVNAIKEDSAFPARLDIRHRRQLYPCCNLWTQLTVLSSGKVALCCMDYDGKVILGDLGQQTITEVWNSERFVEMRRLHLAGKGNSIPICKNCDLLFESAYIWVARTLGILFLLPAARWFYYKYLGSRLNT